MLTFAILLWRFLTIAPGHIKRDTSSSEVSPQEPLYLAMFFGLKKYKHALIGSTLGVWCI